MGLDSRGRYGSFWGVGLWLVLRERWDVCAVDSARLGVKEPTLVGVPAGLRATRVYAKRYTWRWAILSSHLQLCLISVHLD